MSAAIELHKRLPIIHRNGLEKRYVARLLNGGPAWEPYDQLLDRKMTDEEIIALDLEHIRNERYS